jgi:hypothetical protein
MGWWRGGHARGSRSIAAIESLRAEHLSVISHPWRLHAMQKYHRLSEMRKSEGRDSEAVRRQARGGTGVSVCAVARGASGKQERGSVRTDGQSSDRREAMAQSAPLQPILLADFPSVWSFRRTPPSDTPQHCQLCQPPSSRFRAKFCSKFLSWSPRSPRWLVGRHPRHSVPSCLFAWSTASSCS